MIVNGLFKCHKNTAGTRTRTRGRCRETRDSEVAARADVKQTHAAHKMVSSNEIEQVVGIIANEGRERGGESRKHGPLSDLGESGGVVPRVLVRNIEES